MINTRKQRALIARAAPITMAVAGMAAGCLLGYGLAIFLAESWLSEYSTLVAQQQDTAAGEATQVLGSMKASPHPACSDSELAYFRELVFRSTYLKDAGRMHGGKIDCSATADRPAKSIGQFVPAFSEEGGAVAYSNLLPIRDRSLQRAGLQLGNAYVVFAPQEPVPLGHIPMRLTFTMNPPANQGGTTSEPASVAGNGSADDHISGTASKPSKSSTQPAEPNLTVEGTFRQADTLYATRCSSAFFKCVTATTTVPEAFQSEAGILVGGTMLGGLAGGLLGMLIAAMFSRSLNMEQQLRRAISSENLEVNYQPIVSIDSEKIVGAEALARWVDEDGHVVGPDVFIKIAEERGFVTQITRFMLRRALKEFGETLRNRPDFRLSVNVTAQDLCDPGFLPVLDELVKKARISPKSLAIEITESSTANRVEAMETIRELRWRGHSIHIDDFGTGYSSLSYLLYLNVDCIKVDQAFTKAIGTESVTVAILPQILAMAEALKLGVVAEGVENEQQANYFSCTGGEIHGQGWLFGRPMPFAEFMKLLDEQRLKERATPLKPELVQLPQRITA
jgi:sensor c-di-GMP phosphodiesterase-like protein